MPSRKAWLAALAIIAFGTPSLRAQIPGIPTVPTAGVPAAGVGGLTPPTSGLTGFGAGLSACLQKLQAAFCASQIGKMASSMGAGPLASVTGGFLPSLCPPMSAAQAAALGASQPGSAAAAAAAIQASEAGAKARVAAIEYLGTVDCARWPEAQKALINGLRQDPNECVRFAAARALNSGCCCDKKVIKALQICVAGESTDGAPAENSIRVKAAAFSALQNCLMRVPEDLPPETVPLPEGNRPRPTPPPPTPETRNQRAVANPHIATAYNPPRRGPITYDEQLQRETFSQTVDDARRTLFEVSKKTVPPAVLPPGQRSLFGAFTRARNEVSTVNMRRAREQGVVPPGPDQSRVPSTSASARFPTGPAAEPGPSTSTTEAPSDGMVEGPLPISNAEPARASTSTARRGLIGMLFSSRGGN